MLAISSWTWTIVGALGLVCLGILIRVTLALIVRLKDLTRTLSGASGRMQEALDEVRTDLDRATGRLAELRRRGDSDAG